MIDNFKEILKEVPANPIQQSIAYNVTANGNDSLNTFSVTFDLAKGKSNYIIYNMGMYVASYSYTDQVFLYMINDIIYYLKKDNSNVRIWYFAKMNTNDYNNYDTNTGILTLNGNNSGTFNIFKYDNASMNIIAW